MMQDDPVAAFRVEAGEVLDEVEQALLDLGSRLDDATLVNAVFRGLHTVKGSGAMFGFDALAGFTHHCETAFDKVRKGKARASGELVSAVLAACDHMRGLLRAEAGTADDGAGAPILERLARSLEAGEDAPAGATGDARAGGWHLRFRLAPDAMANGVNPLALLAELRELGAGAITALTDAIPPLSELDVGECRIGWAMSLPAAATREAIEDVFLFVLDDMELDLTPLEEGDAARPDVPAGNDAAPPGTPVAARPAERIAEETVRVPAGRLDELMNRVGELVIAQSRLSQIAGHGEDLALRSVSEEIERLAGELRTTMMVLRMVPVANLFGRFRRLVHDLGRETGKQIALVTDGEGTEVDKTVAEALFDPLVHIVRNACDHGIEDDDSRRAAGKPETGTLRLSARQASGQVELTISDDGRGIDLARVRAKAEANGLLAPGAVLPDHELVQLIFQPGFSTAAAVTSLSGRGVGMDVVRRKIEALRGTIDIDSRPGQGTTFTLRIPLTLAIIEGLLVRVGGGHYVLPLGAVEECLELPAETDQRSRGRSLITLRDRLVPFLRLREMFGADGTADPYQKMVVVGAGNSKVGLVVDQIVGSQQTVIKSMSPLHREAAAFAGATILGDGSVALILDIGHLLAVAQPREERLRAVG
ncbi:MAG: chemotaxis protein CheA [Sphingomonadales bacterium]|nr:chemotaxis protein CheA [Sphingomonadales bacterium]